MDTGDIYAGKKRIHLITNVNMFSEYQARINLIC